MKLSDDTLWREIQDEAAWVGWGDREKILSRVLTRVARRHALRDDEARDTLRGRMDRLWAVRAEVLGA